MSIGQYFQQYGPVHRRRAGQGPLIDGQPAGLPRTPRRLRERPTRARRHTTSVSQKHRTTLSPASTDQTSATTLVRARRPARRRAITKPYAWKRFLVVSGLMFMVALLLLPTIVQWQYHGRALPGVSVQGIAVANQPESSLDATLTEHYEPFLDRPLTLSYGQHTWEPTLADLGVSFDMQQATDAALAVGRSANPITGLATLWHLWNTGVDLAPSLTIDQHQLQTYLASLDEEIAQPPRDATLIITPNAIATGIPSETGRQLLIRDTMHDILSALGSLQPTNIVLRTRALPPAIDDGALHEAYLAATDILSGPLTLTHGERQWVWHPPEVASLLAIHSDGQDIRVELDSEKLARKLDGLAQIADSKSVEPRVRFVDGQLQMTREARQGWQLRQEDAANLIRDTLLVSHTRVVELPFDPQFPAVTADMLSELGIHGLVAEGVSSFAGSESYRITNIRAGVNAMDGTLIGPGEEFSFNTHLGPVDAEHGFVQGYAIVNSQTVLEWGGGVCQNPTTVFRAAFWAGLPITEWHPHPFYLQWYDRFAYGPHGDGAGMDATIYTGVQDLRFLNDTGNWLLLQFNMDESSQVLSAQLYGTPSDRHVSFDGPYIDSSGGITVYRTITDHGQPSEPESFYTRFKPW